MATQSNNNNERSSLSSLAAESARHSLKRSRVLFDHGNPSSVFVPKPDPALRAAAVQRRRRQRGGGSSETTTTTPGSSSSSTALIAVDPSSRKTTATTSADKKEPAKKQQQSAGALVAVVGGDNVETTTTTDGTSSGGGGGSGGGILVTTRKEREERYIPTPAWHAPWKCATVLSSHLGWVQSIAMDPTNTMFATGSADRTIKIWNFAAATVGADHALQLTLTGHISPVRGLAFSSDHPYLFSAAEDKQVKCWDLETNQVVRHYHGHLSGVFCLALHPTLQNVLVTAGRDAVARVWDVRSKQQVHCLSGHAHTVASLVVQSTSPSIITGSHDTTIKMWDLVAGKCVTTLTHHAKSVRAMVKPDFERTFVSGAADCLKKWQGKDGKFLKSFTGHDSIVQAMAVNSDGVLVSGGDDGSMVFWDYETGYAFQRAQSKVQPGSLEAENAVLATAFDGTGTRLVTGEADKTIKIWKQDQEASEISHPVDMASWRKKCIAQAKQRY